MQPRYGADNLQERKRSAEGHGRSDVCFAGQGIVAAFWLIPRRQFLNHSVTA